jgi:hypothetical protein
MKQTTNDTKDKTTTTKNDSQIRSPEFRDSATNPQRKGEANADKDRIAKQDASKKHLK